MTKTEIFATVKVEAIHFDPFAEEKYDYLRMEHLHSIDVTAYTIEKVSSFNFKDRLQEYLDEEYYDDERNRLYFGTFSFEDVALNLLTELDLTRVIISSYGTGVDVSIVDVSIEDDAETKFGIKGQLVFVPDDEESLDEEFIDPPDRPFKPEDMEDLSELDEEDEINERI